MNATIAIESLGNTLGNKRAFAITAQNSEIVRGGVNYSLTPTKNRYPHDAARAAFSVVCAAVFYVLAKFADSIARLSA